MTRQTRILDNTILTIIGVVIFGGIVGAAWPSGVILVAIVGLGALFVILVQGAQAMNEPGNFGQGLTAVLSALILLPGAIAASVVLGVTVGVADVFDDDSPGVDMSYDECMADPDTSWSECQELN